MSATPNSHHAYVLVDPAQDYEESDRVLGVYGSIGAAIYAGRSRERNNRWTSGAGENWRNYRNGIIDAQFLEVQHWRGDDLVTITRLHCNGRTEWNAR